MPFVPFYDQDGNPLPPGVEPPPIPDMPQDPSGDVSPPQGDLDGDIHDARVLDLQAARQLQDIRDAVTSQKGMAAQPAADAAEDAIANVGDAVGSQAPTQRARDLFDDVLGRRADVLRQELKAHAEQQKLQAMLDLSNQRQAVAQQDAAAANTPLTFHSNVRTAYDEIDHRADLTGKSADDIDAEKADALRVRLENHG